MRNLNHATITGNLARDPEKRQTDNGTPVLGFTVAVSDERKRGDSWEPYTHFVPVTVFGNRAKGLAKCLRKGSKVGVDGKLSYASWTTEEGATRSKLELVADEVELLTPKPKGEDAPQIPWED